MVIKSVHVAVHNGIIRARKKYSNWSNGQTLWDSAVEGLLVTEIAAAVHRKQTDDEYLLLEPSYDLCEQRSEAVLYGPTPAVLKDSRADIALFNRNDQTEYIIEVKRKVSRKRLREDLVRLCTIVDRCASHRNGRLKRGFLAIYHEGGNYDNIRQWTKRFFRANAKVVRSRYSMVTRDGFSSICIEVGSARR